MTNGQKFMDVFGVARCVYDEKENTTTIHLNGDWWDSKYEEEETITDSDAERFMTHELEYMRSHGTDAAVEACERALLALRYMQEADERTQADRYILQEVLKKVRAEVMRLRNWRAEDFDLDTYCDYFDARVVCRDDVLAIIDKLLAVVTKENRNGSRSSDQAT